jgi:uncharacterized protein (TIGR02246 family)
MRPGVSGFITEGEIMRRMSLLAVVVLVGCSAGKTIEPVPVAARPAAAVPQVIQPPRPFRVADAPARLEVAAAARPAGAADVAAEVRGMLDGYLRDFNRHDPAAVAAHWSDGGESVDLASGEVTSGRAAVRDVFAALFATDADATIDIDVASVRPVRHDVAVVDGQTRLGFTDGGSASSRFSAVVVKQHGRWLVESLRESPLPAAGKVGVAARPLDDLAWLLGAWEDVGEGVTASTQCFWSAGRAFIVRSHAVRPDRVPESLPTAGDTRIPGLLPADDSGPRELTEIIGWDPERQAVRSWLFTSTGRFAEATWTKAGDVWTVRVEGRGRDEGAGCECTLERVGVDGLVVRCSSAALAELLPPACEFTRTARSQ